MTGVFGVGAGARRARWPAWTPLAAVFAVSACFDSPEEGATTELEAVDADRIMYGVSLNMSREGIREALLTADSMFIWRDSTYSHVMGLTLIVFDDRGSRQATIMADAGRLNEMENELTATGNAILRIPGQDREIRTDELHFAPDADRVWTDVPLVMREAGCEFEGDRLQADMSFDDVRIWGTRELGCASG